MIRALVADDEELARRQIVRLLEPYGEDIAIVGQAANGLEAVEKIREQGPDVVFLDVEMPGLDGFQAVRQLTVQPAIVFTTAHAEHALSAFAENTIEYLLKPVAPRDMERAVRKLRRFIPARPGGDAASRDSGAPQRGVASHLLVPIHDRIRPISVDEIVYLESCDKCTEVHTATGSYSLDRSLSEIEERLPRQQFLRVHRRHIVNVRFIEELQKWDGRRMRLALNVPCSEELFVSRRCVDEVRRRLEYGE